MNHRKLVYIAGPYTALHDSTVKQNIAATNEAAKRLYLQGYDVICPNNNTAGWDNDPRIMADHYPTRILDMDLNILSRCDAIYMTRRWKESAGAIFEHGYAKGNGIEVIYEDD